MSDVLSFTFNGVSSETHGVKVTKLPDIIRPAERYDAYTIPGRDGVKRIRDGSREEMILLMECYLPYEQNASVSDIETIRAWLSGQGWFTQSDLPGRKMWVDIAENINFSPWVAGYADRLCTVTMYAEPYYYITPEAAEITITQAGTLINPGTAPSRPLIKITPTGDASIMIGSRSLLLESVTGRNVTIDCENGLVYDDSGNLLTGFATLSQDDWLQIEPGGNNVSFAGAASIKITPRWRDL